MNVSIIVPVYNVESYLERCLNSIINQDYNGQLECLLVDDGSTDNSLKLANQFVKEYRGNVKFRVLCHKENKRQGAARNTGIKVSSGDYLYFLDSDDVLPSDSMKILSTLALKYPDADMILGNTWCNRDIYYISTYELPEYSNDKEWLRKAILNFDYKPFGCMPFTATNRLYKKSLFFNEGLWFKEGSIYEDTYWRVMNWTHVKAVATTPEITYKYYIRENSTINNPHVKTQKTNAYISIYQDYLPTIGNFASDEIRKVLGRVIDHGRIAASPGNELLYQKYRTMLKQIRGNCTLPMRMRIALWYMSWPSPLVKGKVLKLIL